MKNRNNVLLVMLLVTAILVAAIGCYLKYGFLRPFDLYREDPVMAVPFLLLIDKPAQARIHAAMTPTEPTEPTEPPIEPPTEALTEPVVEDATEIATEPQTEPPTEPIVIDESWFDDVLFIGDSRCQPMSVYAPLGDADYFAAAGASIFDIRFRECYIEGCGMINLDRLFGKKTYGKIYIMLGVNGLYSPHEDILKEYQVLIDMIREKQPDAVIIVHSIMTVNREQAESPTKTYYRLENIYGVNEKLAELAVGQKLFYIDVNEVFADEEGYLPDEMTHDGFHLYSDSYQVWAQWLMDTASDFGIS